MSYSRTYFAKLQPEEDCPIEVSDQLQSKYEALDALYEGFFGHNSLYLAKVILFN